MSKHATLYRMVTPQHLCPWGIKARDLLRRNGYEVEDHHLTSAKANEAYKRENGYAETKAVYLEKRDLHCACVGGGSSVPLGFISLTENLMMMSIAIWMMLKTSL